MYTDVFNSFLASFGLTSLRADSPPKPRSVGFLHAVARTELEDRFEYRSERPGVRFEEWTEAYVLTIDAPGVRLDRLRMTCEEGRVTLWVEGSRQEPIDACANGVQPGRTLSFSLPPQCSENIDASMGTGVLRLTVSKRGRSARRSSPGVMIDRTHRAWAVAAARATSNAMPL